MASTFPAASFVFAVPGPHRARVRQNYAFVLILSPEALTSQWVSKELTAARADQGMKIMCVLHRECLVPEHLTEYKLADFRDSKRYDEQVCLLARSVKNVQLAHRGKR